MTVGELIEAIGDATDATVYLPGGNPLRSATRADEGHVALSGDEEVAGSPDEREAFKDAVALLSERFGKGSDDPKIVAMAQEMVAGGYRRSTPVASDGNVVLTPATGIGESEGQ